MNVLVAIINVDAAWMDTEKRKLTAAPEIIKNIFESAPKSANFEVK
jgi:hypothetical protein